MKTTRSEEENGAYQEEDKIDSEVEEEKVKKKKKTKTKRAKEKEEEEEVEEEEEDSTEEVEDAYELRISAAYQDVLDKFLYSTALASKG